MAESVYCSNPDVERHEINDGDRRMDLSYKINWGTDDLRDEWQGAYTFCSFKCLRDWADKRASEHDGTTLKEGV